MEKLGIYVTGCLSDKVEYLPIKKRRPPPRSPSPPPQTLVDDLCSPGKAVSGPEPFVSNSHVAVQRSEDSENVLMNTNVSHFEDSYGIVLLASAAYKSSKGDDVDKATVGAIEEKLLTPVGNDDSMNTLPLEKTSAPSEGDKLFSINSTLGACDGSLDQVDHLPVSLNLLDKTESSAGNCSTSAKDVKFRWDLNTVMDEWEQPGDELNIGTARDAVDNISCEDVNDKKSEENLHNYIGHGDSDCTRELLKSNSEIECPIQTISNPKYFDGCLRLEKDPDSRRLLSEGGMVNKFNTKLTMFAGDDCCTFSMQLGQASSVENVQLGVKDALLVDKAVSNKVLSDLVSIKPKTESTEVFDAPNKGISIANSSSIQLDKSELVRIKPKQECTEMLDASNGGNPNTNLISVQPDKCDLVSIKLKEEYTELFDVSKKGNSLTNFMRSDDLSRKSGEAGFPHVSSDQNNMSMSATILDEGQPNLVDFNERKFVIAPPEVATLVNSSTDVEMKEPLCKKPYGRLGEVAPEEFDDGDVSDISLGGQNHLVSLGKVTKYPAGYESPFEDGEVRESIAHSWEENECETECLDYDIDDRDADDFGTFNHYLSEAGSESIQNGDNVNLTGKGSCGSVNSVKESSNSVSVENVSEPNQLAMAVEANNINAEEIVASRPIHRLDVKGLIVEELGPRAVRAKLSPHIVESPASEAFDEKDRLYMQQGRCGSRFQTRLGFRSDNYLARNRRISQVQDERHKSNWVGAQSSYWDSENRHQNGYRRGGGHYGPRSNNMPDSEANDEGLERGSGYQRRSTNFPMKGTYRPFVRRGAPDNSENDCGMHRGSSERRDDHRHVRNRGSSGTYQRGDFRGPRGDYHGPISNDSATPSSGWVPVKRRRSLSPPIVNRNSSFSRPCRKSRSRSRSRSPIPWNKQEERNIGSRRISRSPDFIRSEPRMGRTRSRCEDNTRFSENDTFLSPPRKRFPSQGHSVWVNNDRNSGPSQRFLGQRQGFDTRDPIERTKSDDCFRPRGHPQRFSEPSGEVWRGNNFDHNDNERTNNKYKNKYEMVHRVRQNEASGASRRFVNNGEGGCFDVQNTRNDKGWAGRGSFKYERERM